MERRDEELELDKLLDEIPTQRQMLYRNSNTNNNIAFYAATQNPPPLGIDRSLEYALARLSISPPHQSPLVTTMLDNPAAMDPLILPYLSYQQTAMELQRLTYARELAALMHARGESYAVPAALMHARGESYAVPAALMHARGESYAVPALNPRAMGDESRREFFNGAGGINSSAAASINGCGKSCCRYQPRNKSCLQLPRPSSREYTKRSNGNGFRLDSGHCRVAPLDVDGQFLGTENPNTLRSPFGLHHMQQNPNYSSLEDLRGRMVAVAKDQHGCRFLQKKFEEGRVEETEIIFAEVKDHVGELMVHPYGNYLVQKLSETCTDEQKMEIVHTITKEEFQLVTICIDIHGTRAVQKLLECLTTPEQISCVMLALRPGTVILTKDWNGHHVIQRCLQLFSNEDNKYLLNTVADHFIEIATDSSGCCVMQHCVAHAKGGSRERLFAEITANALLLAQDPYGNYVVQYILGLKIPHVMAAVMRQFEGNYISLSMQKFSSHVVEKCLKESEEAQSTRIVKELLSSSKFVSLLEDAYGNYVVQSALSVLKVHGDTYKAMVDLVQNHIPSMRSNPYGKRIIYRINARR